MVGVQIGVHSGAQPGILLADPREIISSGMSSRESEGSGQTEGSQQEIQLTLGPKAPPQTPPGEESQRNTPFDAGLLGLCPRSCPILIKTCQIWTNLLGTYLSGSH